MYKKILIILCLSLSLFMYQNCSEFKATGSNVDASQISNFTFLSENLFTTSCAGCHSGVSPQGGIDLSTYANINASGVVTPGDASASSLYTILAAGLTPHDEVDLTMINAIELWINNGASENEDPTVDAGSNVNLVLPNTSANLTAQASDVDGEISTYLWVQGSGPNTASLSGDDTANLNVSGLVIGSYSFLVTVTDDFGNMATDTVNVNVTDAPNNPPTVTLGADRTIVLPTNSIDLTSSASDSDGSIASYLWSQVSGPNTATITGETTNTLNATSLIEGTYVFNLVVTDDDGATANDSINVIVAPVVPNMPPTVTLGADRTITLPTNSITLPATANDPDGTIAGYAWTQGAGPNTASLAGQTTNTLTASGLIQGTYVFTIVVTDDEGATGTDSINVVVGSNNPPTVTLGADRNITLPTNSVSISATANDSDGTIASYAWTQGSGPNTASLAGQTTNSLTASGLIEGTYVFTVVVTDNDGATGTDSINVVVAAAPAPTLSQLKTQIFNSKCAGCHIGGSVGGYNMDTYSNLMMRVEAGNSGISSLYNEVNEETMPTGSNKLTQSEKNMVRDWIDAGALDN